MTEPILLSNYEAGYHNIDLSKTVNRLKKSVGYKDIRTVIITPSMGMVPPRVALSWQGMMRPPNSCCPMIMAVGAEVGEAYSACVASILNHPDMGKWPYICTVEHDNVLTRGDELVRLLEQMEEHPEYAAISSLYFTKGESGVAQIWGDHRDPIINFRPQLPVPNVPNTSLVECNGTGMGFAIFRLSMFRDERLRRPWFKTATSKEDGAFTQDLYFWMDAKKYGYRCAVDVNVKVGHLDWDGKFGEKGRLY